MKATVYKSNRAALSSAGMSGVFAMVKDMCRPLAMASASMMTSGFLAGLTFAHFAPVTWFGIAVVALIVMMSIALTYRSFRDFGESINRRGLGVQGERVVATQLAELGRDGHIIVHDLPLANMNIDHLIIGPKGVIVVETKMRSKKVDVTGSVRVTDEAVIVDGGVPDAGPINQVKLGMSLVRERLALRPTDVHGIVVYPERWVDEWRSNNIAVLNDKRVFQHIRNLPDAFSYDQAGRVYAVTKAMFDAELRASTPPEARA